MNDADEVLKQEVWTKGRLFVEHRGGDVTGVNHSFPYGSQLSVARLFVEQSVEGDGIGGIGGASHIFSSQKSA